MRRIAVVMGLVVGSLWAFPGPAQAGGYCQEPGSATEGEGTTVTMGDNCFSPTVLRTEEGSTVSFINKDAERHTVTSAGGAWGDPHLEIAQGEVMRVEFPKSGVYAYTCMLHPGMSGSIIVGDGTGLGAGATLIDVERLDSPEPLTRTIEKEAGIGPTIGLALGAAVIAGGAGYVVGRRRRRALALPTGEAQTA